MENLNCEFVFPKINRSYIGFYQLKISIYIMNNRKQGTIKRLFQ